MYQCEECNYESFYKFNVDKHVAAKHKHLKVQVHQTGEQQPVHGEQAQLVHQQPVQVHQTGGQQPLGSVQAQRQDQYPMLPINHVHSYRHDGQAQVLYQQPDHVYQPMKKQPL